MGSNIRCTAAERIVGSGGARRGFVGGKKALGYFPIFHRVPAGARAPHSVSSREIFIRKNYFTLALPVGSVLFLYGGEIPDGIKSFAFVRGT